MTPRLHNFVLAGLASMALGSAALAGGPQNPGSLLIFPFFDNDRSFRTFLTVTNTADHAPVAGPLRVEYVYIRHEEQIFWNGENNPLYPLDCTEFNRTRILTAQDTLTVDTKTDNPNQKHKGYVYVFAKRADNSAISWNYLIGEVRVLSSDPGDTYECQPFTYKGIGADETVLAAAPTTVNHLLLNGTKYEATSDVLLFPRFTGQNDDGDDQLQADSSLVLIALSGGSQFTSLVDLTVFNDNEEVFSAQDSVRCWSRKKLSWISNVFDDDFLVTTNQADSESVDGTETGWFTAHGLIASSSNTTIQNPAILGVLLEKLWDDEPNIPLVVTPQYAEAGGAILPYGTGVNTKGVLLSHALNGS
jgi:hypothetical protein